MHETFHLSDSFLQEYKIKPVSWGPLGYITYRRSYSRPIPQENRTEEWWETIRRVVEGTYLIQKTHCKRLKLPWNDHKAQQSAQEMYELMFNMKFLPPGRGLWMMGTSYIEERGTSAPLYNCAFTSTKQLGIDFAAPFIFLMDMSMLGVGVGFDTKGAGTLKIKEPKLDKNPFIVEDTREGWVLLIERILNAYVHKGSLPQKIDTSLIRPYGTPIKGFGGSSSGPAPLIELVQNIQDILNPLIGHYITSSAIVDLNNAIGKCVVSGNVRRSSEIALGSLDDDEFLDLKDPNKHSELLSKWRWASNNSITAEVGSNYDKIVDRIINNGEPGIVWLNNARKYGRLIDGATWIDHKVDGTNPCGEISLEDMEFCNVPETFPSRHDSYEEYERTLKFAYLYAKTVTLLPTHNDRVNAVQLRNRRIGLSMSGIVQNIQRRGIREHFSWCNKGYEYLSKLDKIYSDWLCIPVSIKKTSIKPSGSISLLPGVTPGIHFPKSEYYYRTIRIDSGSQLTKALLDANYLIVKGEGHNTSIVYFPVKEEYFSKSVKDVSMWEQLEIAAQTQYYWADNQVSITVEFSKEEAKDIKKALELYETRLKSVSFLPKEDHGYEHAPYQPITKEEYENAIKKLKPIHFNNSTETEGFNNKFCDSEVCELPKK